MCVSLTLLQEVCYKYWPSSGVQQVGEFTIDILGEEKLEGFALRTFGVLHKKVQATGLFYITDRWTPNNTDFV